VAAPKVLITGATGFVGSHVVERFARSGARQRALVRPTSDTRLLHEVGAELVTGDLTGVQALRSAVAGVDVVVHLAALTHANSEAELLRVNGEATHDLLRATLDADPAPRRFVYLSSLAAAGPSRDGRPVRPADPPRPLTSYGRSKLAGEAACRATNQIEVAVLRAPAVYGPRDRELLRFFRMAKFGWMPVPGGPARSLQLVHASDLADAVVLAALQPAVDGLFHIAEPRAWAWDDVVRFIFDAVGTKPRTFRVPGAAIDAAAFVAETFGRLAGRTSLFNREKVRELLAPAWICETDGAKKAFGFEAAIALPHGLMQTAEWYRQNGWL
jgi:nucleoside-diphosphate-sugar epimerase